MIEVLSQTIVQPRKALSVQVSHRFAVGSAVFDEEHLVSCAGLVPVMSLAEQTGLGRLLGEKVRIAVPRIKSGAANPAPKLATVVAGMCAGADSIDDIDVVRSGGMKALFGGVYAPSTVGTLLREFTFGHARQLESVLSAAAMCCYGKQARKFLSWLPDRVDSAVRQLDSTQVTSFMVSYCQDRNISSAKATVVLH